MYRIVNGTDILLTRGDTFECDITIYDGDEAYSPAVGDVIKFYLKHAKMNPQRTGYAETSPLITKTIDNSTLKLHLDPTDTASLGFGAYVYDIELTKADTSVDTFINNANFVLIPEVG